MKTLPRIITLLIFLSVTPWASAGLGDHCAAMFSRGPGAKLTLQGAEWESVVPELADPVILHLFGPTRPQSIFMIKGGTGWLAEAAKQFESQGLNLAINPKMHQESAAFVKYKEGMTVELGSNLINRPFSPVFLHELVHAKHANEAKSDFAPEMLITLVSPEGRIPTFGYEKYLGSDEVEAFFVQSEQYLKSAESLFKEGRLSEARKDVGEAGSANIMFENAFSSIWGRLSALGERVSQDRRPVKVIDKSWLIVEDPEQWNPWVSIVFRIDTTLPKEKIKAEILRQIESRVAMLETYRIKFPELKRKVEELNSRILAILPDPDSRPR